MKHIDNNEVKFPSKMIWNMEDVHTSINEYIDLLLYRITELENENEDLLARVCDLEY